MDNSACGQTNAENESNERKLFEDCAWLYAFCREYLFRDHTEEIAQALFPDGAASRSAFVLEAGCGPGFYSRRLAKRFPASRVLGIDRSSRLVSWAQWRALSKELTNCHFREGDVECLSDYVEGVDAVVSSRLLLVVGNRQKVIAEMFRVLRPGGLLFLAEPTANFKTQLPILAMQFATRFALSSRRHALACNARVMASRDFEEIVRSQPWSNVSIRMHGDYQCAICQKCADWSANKEGLEAERPEDAMKEALDRGFVAAASWSAA